MKTTKTIIGSAVVAALIVLAPAVADAKTKTPAACRTALTEAEAIIRSATQVDTDVGAYFHTLSQSASAHASGTLADTAQFIGELTTATKLLNGQITDETANVTPHIVAYRSARSTCLAGA